MLCCPYTVLFGSWRGDNDLASAGSESEVLQLVLVGDSSVRITGNACFSALRLVMLKLERVCRCILWNGLNSPFHLLRNTTLTSLKLFFPETCVG